MPESQDRFRATARVGRFNWLNPKEESVNLYVKVPGIPDINIDLPADRFAHWGGLLLGADEALEGINFWLEQLWISSSAEAVKAAKSFLETDEGFAICEKQRLEDKIKSLDASIQRLQKDRDGAAVQLASYQHPEEK